MMSRRIKEVAIMKALITHLVAFLFGLSFAIALAASAKSISKFQISLTAKGRIEMECSEGCAWERLSWTCNEKDLSQECTIAFNEFGMGGSG